MTEGHNFLQFLYAKYSESDYLETAWSSISEIVNLILHNSIDNFKPISYQAVYCQVYKSTCKGYKERLFDDLKKLIAEYCHTCKSHLDEALHKINDNRSNFDMNLYVTRFANYWEHFYQALKAIVPLFHYLDVVYIKPKLRSTINQELFLIYKNIVIESHIRHILSAIHLLINTSESPSTETIRSLLQMILDDSPEFINHQPDVFKRYFNGDDRVNRISSNDEDIIMTTTSKTSSKRSVDELSGEEDEPSAKRTSNTFKSSDM